MISFDYTGGNRQRIGMVENRICDGNGQIADGMAEYHVTEINDADHPLMSHEQIAIAADDNIVIIGIVMNNAFAQLREQRCNDAFEISGEFFDQLPQIGIHYQQVVILDDP